MKSQDEDKQQEPEKASKEAKMPNDEATMPRKKES